MTLNRPEKKNAVTAPMWSRLEEVFGDVGGCEEDRVLVLTGAGGAFCAGADLSAAELVTDPDAVMGRLARAATALFDLPKPTIAKVNGVAVGAGWNLALACDLVVAAADASFSQIFARRGLSIDFGGSWILPRLVGPQRAKELTLLADTIPAQAALELGLVNRVVGTAQLDDFVAGWAGRLAAGATAALAESKRLLNHSPDLTFAEALEAEGRSQLRNFATSDAAEALAAFLEKRPPTFLGR